MLADAFNLTAAGQGTNDRTTEPLVPLADHHTHVWSLTASQLVVEPLMPAVELPAELARLLRDTDGYAKVRAENDWLAEQVARHRDRLVGFCSFNPVEDYALAEPERCAKSGSFKGVKFHVGNSRIDLLDPAQAEKLRAVMRAANERRFPVLIHLWTPGR